MTHVACELKLRSIMKSLMYPCPGNWVAIGRTVIYYARAELNVGTVISIYIEHTLGGGGVIHGAQEQLGE